MVNTVSRYTFETKRSIKSKKIKDDITLNINYSDIDVRDVYGLYLTNKTTKNNILKLPDIGSFVDTYPDFLALETEPGLYRRTENTCVCWFKDDSVFDTIDGLYNAIVHKDVTLLKYYKSRYSGVKYFIATDYSLYGDFDFETVLHNLKKSAVVYMWLTIECEAIVFSLMTYSNEKSLDWCFEHIMIGSNVAVSLKGVMKGEERNLFIKALKALVDTRKPKALIVYTTGFEESTMEMLQYAVTQNIKIIIADNTLLNRNRGVI